MDKELIPSPEATPPKDVAGAAPPALTWRQMVYLLVLCEHPLEPTRVTVAACQQARPDANITVQTVEAWRRRPTLRALVHRIKADPGFAASFLLEHTQVDAARRLRDILLDSDSGGRVASDAAAQVLRASRESARNRSAFDFLDKLLRKASESKSD